MIHGFLYSLPGLVLAPAGVADDGRILRVGTEDVSRAILEARPWDGMPRMMLALSLVLFGFGVLLAVRAYRRGRANPPGWLLFNRVARSAGLCLRHRWLLWRAGRSLPTPLALLVAAGTLDRHLAVYTASLPAARQERVRRAASQIRARLFPNAGGPPDRIAGV